MEVMTRFRLLVLNEFKLARTAVLVHLIAIFQPTILFVLMSFTLVYPTWDVNVIQPVTDEGRALVAAMREVGSPIGEPYINPITVSPNEADEQLSQVVVVETRHGVPTAVQRFGLIDSNQVKNFRNRLTAAALRLWNDALGERAVTVEERPWLPRDVPYVVYYGMAMLPMTTFLAGFIGGILTAQDFEFGTIMEVRLAPAAPALPLAARLTRLVLLALLSAGVLLVTLGWHTGVWPDSIWLVGLILLPMAIIASSLGTISGLVLRHSIPTLVVGLLTTLGGWIVGSAFGLAASFGGLFERISRLTPNTHAVELLFPRYYGTVVGTPQLSALVLMLFSTGILAITVLVYYRRVVRAS
jgi:ABC-type multidrug transport system permease subunit